MTLESIEELLERARKIPKEKKDEFINCLKEKAKESRHTTHSTEINYRSWDDFDVVAVFAANSPDPLKSVFLGYMYRGDVPCLDKFIEGTSVSTDVQKAASKNGIQIQVMSYEEARKKAVNINWNKIKKLE